MKTVNSTAVASFAEPSAKTDIDRSAEVLQLLPKEPRDQVTCVRVFGDFYRCNWWAPGALPGRNRPEMPGLEVSTYRVRKSQFVRAILSEGKLLVEDATFSEG
jgi:hypothetical protein